MTELDAEILFHVSDVHFGVEDKRALEVLARAVESLKPAGIVCTGDLTQRAFHVQYAAAREYLSQLDAPVMLFPGNHDMPYFNLLERFTRPYARCDALADAVAQEIVLKNAVLVPFDTNVTAQARWPWSDGVVTEQNLAATLARLEGLRGDPRLKLVACHHPLLPPRDGEKNATIGGDAAFAALADAGANVVLSGHIHTPFDMVRERGGKTMRMIGAGTMSTRLRGAPPSWNIITIEHGALSVEHRVARS